MASSFDFTQGAACWEVIHDFQCLPRPFGHQESRISLKAEALIFFECVAVLQVRVRRPDAAYALLGEWS